MYADFIEQLGMGKQINEHAIPSINYINLN